MVGTSGSTVERLAGGGAERAHLAGLDVRRHGGDGVECHLHVAADHAVAHLAGRLVRHVHEIGAAHRFEQLRRHVIGRAGAGRSVVELPRLRLGIGDEFLEILRRHRRMDHHHQVGIVDPRHRHEVAHQLERLVGDERLVRGVGVRHREQRVTVGRGLGDRVAADDRARARPVLDHERLLERLRQVLGQNAGIDVGGAAGAERHHDLDRARRIVLRRRYGGPRQRQGKRESRYGGRNGAQRHGHFEFLRSGWRFKRR